MSARIREFVMVALLLALLVFVPVIVGFWWLLLVVAVGLWLVVAWLFLVRR